MYVYFVEVDIGDGHKVDRRIADTPDGFAKWKRGQEARGNKVRVKSRLRTRHDGRYH